MTKLHSSRNPLYILTNWAGRCAYLGRQPVIKSGLLTSIDKAVFAEESPVEVDVPVTVLVCVEANDQDTVHGDQQMWQVIHVVSTVPRV